MNEMNEKRERGLGRGGESVGGVCVDVMEREKRESACGVVL